MFCLYYDAAAASDLTVDRGDQEAKVPGTTINKFPSGGNLFKLVSPSI